MEWRGMGRTVRLLRVHGYRFLALDSISTAALGALGTLTASCALGVVAIIEALFVTGIAPCGGGSTARSRTRTFTDGTESSPGPIVTVEGT